MTTPQILSLFFIVPGVLFMLVSSVGLIRLPDFYIRNSASTKAMTLGTGLVLVGVIISFNSIDVMAELLAIIFFILLITPLAAHIMTRAAVKTGVPFWKKTSLKELEDYPGKAEKKAESK